MNYIDANRRAYNLLANEYDSREHEIGDDFWLKIYDELKLKDKTYYKVLEIGPGNGRNIGVMKRYNSNFDITAIELSENLCGILRKNYNAITIINQNILEVESQSEKYDLIVAIALIHLFPAEDAKKVLKIIRNMLKDDGYLLIGTTINKEETEGYYEKEDYNIKVKRFRHKYTKESFEQLLTECGFKVFKPYIITEKERAKTWYDIVVVKD